MDREEEERRRGIELSYLSRNRADKFEIAQKGAKTSEIARFECKSALTVPLPLISYRGPVFAEASGPSFIQRLIQFLKSSDLQGRAVTENRRARISRTRLSCEFNYVNIAVVI